MARIALMKLDNLIANLNNPDAIVRLEVAQVLGMVEETRALKAVGEQYKRESDPVVKKTLAVTGKRLYTAHNAGYSTLDQIIQQFKLEREIDALANTAEGKLLQQMQSDLDRELIQGGQRAAQKKAGMTAAAGIAGAVIGGSAMGVGMMGAAMQTGAEVASSNLGQARPQIGQSRVPAMMPTTTDITMWLKRLHSGDVPTRLKAMRELATMNNPAALPHLAKVYLTDSSQEVRAAAQQAGKTLYWNTAYWHMEQSGELAQVIQTLAAKQGQPAETASTDPAASEPQQPESPPSQPQQDDINAILRRAKAARKRRNKR
jgi:hypothetical protein